jgi:hypothetical protein
LTSGNNKTTASDSSDDTYSVSFPRILFSLHFAEEGT